MTKKLGVIGGMGPEATSFFYSRIIAATKADRDQEHIDMLILSHASMPDRTAAIISGCREPFLQAITEDIRTLEQWGAANIAIPCNTSHYFFKELRAVSGIPLIDMVGESVRYLRDSHPEATKAGILATDGTLHAGIYHQACQNAGLEAVSPDSEAQKAVMSLIYDDIKRGITGDPQKFRTAYDNLTGQGCDVVILACTELSVFREYHPVPSNCIDAMDVLVRESVLRSGAQIRDTYA